MKGSVILAATVAVLLMPALEGVCQQKPATREVLVCSESGRYQLFQGSYTTFDLKRKETYVHQAVFLLDSQTGEVKRYINKIDEEGRYIETWLPTDLPPADKRR